MKCKFCNQSEYIHRSKSLDRWYLRLVLSKFFRCRYCGAAILARIWSRPASSETATAPVCERKPKAA